MARNPKALTAGILGAAVASALGFSSDSSSLDRGFDTLSTTPSAPITVTASFVNGSGADLRGFFYTDQLPSGLIVTPLSVRIDGRAIQNYTLETGAAGQVYPGCTPRRWVLESPAGFAELNPVPAGGRVEITYSLTSLSAGVFYLQQFTWAAWQPNAVAASFGTSENSDVQTVSFAVGNTNTNTNTISFNIGTFNGLFFENSSVENADSGFFTFTMRPNLSYTAALRLMGKKYSVRGTLSAGGTGSNTISRPGMSPLTVLWQAGVPGPDHMAGTVSDGQWVSPLAGDRAGYNARTNPAPQAGRYTVIIPGKADAAASPEGDGYGSVSVSSSGAVRFTGKLADGTSVSQSGVLSPGGNWPFYAALYRNGGGLMGWLQFQNRVADDLSGTLVWLKPALTGNARYPGAFSIETDAAGSRFSAPSGQPILAMTQASVRLDGGNLPDTSVNPVSINAAGRVTNNGTNKLSLTFSRSTGLFTGSHTQSGTTRKNAFRGAVLQKANQASGYFLGPSQSGRVWLESTP